MTRSLTALSIAFAICATAPLHADTLDDVLRSPGMNKIVNTMNNASADLLSPKWLPPGTNFAMLFATKTSVLDALQWLFSTVRYDHHKQPEALRADEFLLGHDRVIMPGGGIASVFVYIPHPKFRDSIELGLVPEINKLEPPVLKVSKSNPFQIRGFNAVFYRHEGACSVVVRLSGEARVRTLVQECLEDELLMRLTRSLDFERLEQKLTS